MSQQTALTIIAISQIIVAASSVFIFLATFIILYKIAKSVDKASRLANRAVVNIASPIIGLLSILGLRRNINRED